MTKLFAVVLGGRAEGCNTELHDVVFVTGNEFITTYPTLKTKWFGCEKRLHIDSYVELKWVDGHEVILSDQPPAAKAPKLFFANFGGYKANHFGEIHDARFYVANSKSEVLARAKAELGLSLIEAHCDDNVIVDDIIEVEDVGRQYIHLTPTDKCAEFNVTSGYIRLS